MGNKSEAEEWIEAFQTTGVYVDIKGAWKKKGKIQIKAKVEKGRKIESKVEKRGKSNRRWKKRGKIKSKQRWKKGEN